MKQNLAKSMWLVLSVVLMADIIDLIDATLTNIAAPTITHYFGGGNSLIQWLGASYSLALGALLVTGGRLGDRYGRRKLFLISIAGFTFASVFCGLAWNSESIIIGRIVQGMFGALLLPQGFGLILLVFPRENLGKAFSCFGPVLGLSAVIGPIFAGFLIEANIFDLGWRSMFLINIFLGGAAFIMGWLFLPQDEGDKTVVVDFLGSVLLALAMLGLLAGVIEGAPDSNNNLRSIYLSVGMISLLLFILRQKAAKNPLIMPSLFKNKGFVSGLILGVAYFAAVSGLLYAFSLFMQDCLSYTPFEAALGLTVVTIGIITSSIVSFKMIGLLGRKLVAIGLILTAVGAIYFYFVIVALGMDVSFVALMPSSFIMGLGMGASFGTIFDITIGDIDESESGSASGSLSAIQQLSNSIGIAIVTSVYFSYSVIDKTEAMSKSLLIVIIISLLSISLVWFMPKHAREQLPH